MTNPEQHHRGPGGARITAKLWPDTAAALDKLRLAYPDTTLNNIINRAVIAHAKALHGRLHNETDQEPRV